MGSLGNALYFGDCLDVMREDIPDQSIDLIYLDPPFNSKRLYNAFMGGAQWVAFSDTWQWYEAVDDFHDVASRVHLAPMIEGLRTILGEGPDLAYLSYMANRLAECHRVLKPGGAGSICIVTRPCLTISSWLWTRCSDGQTSVTRLSGAMQVEGFQKEIFLANMTPSCDTSRAKNGFLML
nr:hypothetical protein [bacterium]